MQCDSQLVVCTTEGPEPDDGGAEGEGGESEDGCTDREGARVPEGALYRPDIDPCIECTCLEGSRSRCMTVMCRPPSCEWERIEGQCCQFRCLDAVGDDTVPPAHCTYLLAVTGRRPIHPLTERLRQTTDRV